MPIVGGRAATIGAMTLVIAHRGASRAEPENTVAAFRAASEMGADGVELDVRRTADDRLVVHHDPILADGRVIRATRATDLPEEIPTLAAALDACAGMFVNVEIKNEAGEPDFDPTEWVAHHVVAELAARRSPSRWLISSFRIETIDRCRRLAPDVRTAWLVMEATDAVVDAAVLRGHVALHPWVDRLDARTVARTHASGLAVNTWTCDDPDRMRELMAWGVDGVCTNVPDLALEVRAGGPTSG